MNKEHSFNRRRIERIIKTRAFFKRNGAYIAVALVLLAIGGLIALFPFGRESGDDPGAPAENSLDERLTDAKSSASPIPLPSLRPLPTLPPVGGEATEAPTVMPELTVAPSREPEPTQAEKLNPPVDGRLIRPYSMDSLIYSKTLNQWMTHSGVDISAPNGAEVRAVAEGTVEWVIDDDLMGTCVLIDHGDGFKTLCCGLKRDPPVHDGDAVPSRGLIGYVGNTAISECAEESHLHFEVLKNGLPADPEGYVLIPREG